MTEPELQTIPVAELTRRIGVELHDLAETVARTQAALGPVLTRATDLPIEHVLTLQSLDRLQQTLEDLARILVHLATTEPSATRSIAPAQIAALARLNSVACRLAAPGSGSETTARQDETGGITWL